MFDPRYWFWLACWIFIIYLIGPNSCVWEVAIWGVWIYYGVVAVMLLFMVVGTIKGLYDWIKGKINKRRWKRYKDIKDD